MSVETASEITFGIETYARVVVIVASAAQAMFYFSQRQKGRCGWEKLYTAVAETVTYIIVTSIGSAGVVTVAGRPWLWPRYAGWLSTCPVLLIDVSMIPMPAAREPGTAMTSILAFQLVVLLGQTSIFYTDPALRVTIFLAAVACGLFVFKLVFDTFVRAWRSFPESETAMRNWLLITAACFFFGWVAFPVLFAVGAEGFGGLGADGSALAHAIADLVAKNLYSYASWYLRWVIIREYLDRRAAEAADLESRKNRAIKDAEAGYSEGGAPVEASPAGTSAIVAALAAEERELQRPIDVADVLGAAAEITDPAVEEVFAAVFGAASLTAPAILAGVLPAALARQEAIRLHVAVVDRSSTRQAAAARQIKATDAAVALGVTVRFAFRPGDVAHVRAAHGGRRLHAVVITDEALFQACEEPGLDEGEAPRGAGGRAGGAMRSHASFAPFGGMVAGATIGTMLGAEHVSTSSDDFLSGTEEEGQRAGGRANMVVRGAAAGLPHAGGAGAAAGAGGQQPAADDACSVRSDLSAAPRARGLHRVGSALAVLPAEEPPLARSPRGVVAVLRAMAAGADGEAVVVVVSTGSGGDAAAREPGLHPGRVSLYDVGADVVIPAMGRTADWGEAMAWVAEVAEDAVEASADAAGAAKGGDITDAAGDGWGGSRRKLERGASSRWRRRRSGDESEEHDGRGKRRGDGDRQRRDSGGSDEDSEARQRRRWQVRHSASSEDADGVEESRSVSESDSMGTIDDATGGTQLLAEAVRAALDAAARAVLPQSLARVVSGVARSADAVVDERVQQRQDADERRAAEGLVFGGESMTHAGYAMMDAGVETVARSEVGSLVSTHDGGKRPRGPQPAGPPTARDRPKGSRPPPRREQEQEEEEEAAGRRRSPESARPRGSRASKSPSRDADAALPGRRSSVGRMTDEIAKAFRG
ncbi:hypothetical protein FNF29_02300 [Cafeteria roenbergensis]|uniref:Uncharacterized protein n=1 Tax=Cafeteria roenbergensis TaxID=33653 RepID=A0A5A8CSF6_CAFRO|nr:hypothetical protein FNF29_02300 [Cafeteria roenbergensis]|eukprot:KAA0154771.1 hypothetical protein FNF29_02300 [Cafeteria roenbergensis]